MTVNAQTMVHRSREFLPTADVIYACAHSTLIGFRDELTDQQIKFICDQISRKVIDSGETRKP